MSSQLRQAWQTVVPDPAGRHGPLPPVLLVLTVVTGVVDAFSYLALGHVFVANMTGNVVFLAFSIAGAPGFSIWASAVALLAFAAGAVLGGQLAHRNKAHRGKLLWAASLLELLLMLAGYLFAQVHGDPYDGVGRYVLIVLLGLAMGCQNAAARALAVPDLTTTVLTLTITGISADGRLAGGADSRIGRRLISTLAMFSGALIGGLIALHGSPPVVLLIATILLVTVVSVATRLTRSTGAWVTPS